MGKIKILALTSIMLSSTLLGASPLIVQAKSASKIAVQNALIESTTATKSTNASVGTTFKDLKDNTTMSVAPIFGKTGSEFNAKLADELNVVDSSDTTTLMPMTVVNKNKFGFVTKVTYTNGDTIKTVNVEYNFAKPTVVFANNSQTMNFTTGTVPAENKFYSDINDKGVSAATTNGDDANGTKNEAKLSSDIPTTDMTAAGSYTIAYTPKDAYATGDTVNRTVNVIAAPDWSEIANRSVAMGDTNAVKNPFIIKNSKGQLFSVAPSAAIDVSKAGEQGVEYTATAIDKNGNALLDSSTGKAMTWTNKDSKVTVVDPATDSTKVPYTISFVNENGKVVGQQTGEYNSTGTTDSNASADATEDTDSDELTEPTPADATTTKKTTKATTTAADKTITITAPEGFTLKTASDATYTVGTDLTKISKSVDVVPSSLSYTVKYIDKDTGKTVGTPVEATGTYGDYIPVSAPTGYELANVVDRGFTLKTDKYEKDVYVKKSNVQYTVTFVDQESGKTVGITTGKGADGEDVTLTAPKGFAFVNANDMQFSINKDNPDMSLLVTPSKSEFLGTITTYPKNGTVNLYDKNGKELDDIVLSQNSNWITDQKVYIDNVKYYRVATNQYVKASDVYLYTPLSKIATTNGNGNTTVYDSKGAVITDRALGKNTSWKADKAAKIKGSLMYRVATNEWVKLSDVTLN
ncbi:SLAP domain-containing protein [Companilactobacillus hulinensis]|uniref:SLAP domain-containing protein n=1 Tax=Companilactobacillus hulinensis TaxID=2486007 RepID=UPI000F798125|nr:SLAP domain-containing protein [Companilactobacillus hulinensis]